MTKNKNNIKLPELLMPVGNIEAFNAAVEGGADAVFMGLKAFNARGRATNFSAQQVSAMCEIARENKVQIYITLNVVIKNHEISALLDTLHLLNQFDIAAVIIQDWGVYSIAKRYFPGLVLHASTQMANHNSSGAIYSKMKGFERVVMAREITAPELNDIVKRSDVELEVFTHGALCYSFSGMCYFSSYLGGAGANRGLCTQPCRRVFNDQKSDRFIFSLKDNQLIDYIPNFIKLGIDSLKIEGRMKSADYVYQVARAYRLALDNPEELGAAKELLKYDMGREKTAYFMEKNVSAAITENPNTGIYLGNVKTSTDDEFTFFTNETLTEGSRIRLRTPKGEERKAFKLRDFSVEGRQVTVRNSAVPVSKGDKIFLAGIRFKKFSNKLDREGKNIADKCPGKLKNKVLGSLIKQAKPLNKEEMYVRIDSFDWMRKIHIDSVDSLFFSFTKTEWEKVKLDAPFLQKNRSKIWVELPRFIPEKAIESYKTLYLRLFKAGYTKFVVSHLSQTELLPKDATFSANENVLAYNDAAIAEIKRSGAQMHISPIENDMDNLFAGKDRSAIVPMYMNPLLFYSRMPVRIEEEESKFRDDTGLEFQRFVRDGITHVVPTMPSAMFQYKKLLVSKGFRRFMIDLSFEKVSKNRFKTVLNKFTRSEQIQPSNTFNFKKGLK